MIVGLKYARESLVQKGETTQRGKEKTCNVYVCFSFIFSFFFFPSPFLWFVQDCLRDKEQRYAAD